MILAVCVQNSVTTLAGYSEQGQRSFTAVAATDPRATSDRLAVDYSQLMALYGVSATDVSGSILASVVPAQSETAAEAIKHLTGRRPMLLGPGTRTGFAIETANPSELGADIVALIAGALAKHEPPLVVAYFGDALVVAAVDEKSRFRGCAIAPGVKMSLETMANAALFGSYGFSMTSSPLGLTTRDSVNSGLSYGIAGAAEMLCRSACAEAGATTVIAAGDHAAEFVGLAGLKAVIDDDLLCDGLYAVYVKNAQSKRR